MLTVLYSDRHVAVCIKPAGVLSQDAGENSMPQLLQKQLNVRQVFPVHRLDREAGGVMVYALNQKAAAALSRAIQAGGLEKQYLAVLQGSPEQDSGLLEDLLYHDKGKNKTYVVKRLRKGVKDARLEYQVLERTQDQTLVQIRLLTGRTHQIRVQFASRRLPLAGDGKYGGGSGSLGLWSYRLCFPHPAAGKMLQFVQNPPEESPWDQFLIRDSVQE